MNSGNDKRWAIVSLLRDDEGELLYWSNDDGWADASSADTFSTAEMLELHLPIGGAWVVFDDGGGPSFSFHSDDWCTYQPYTRDPGEWQVRAVKHHHSVIRTVAAEVDDDGRSNWFWVHTPDGDIMLACFPRGDTFMECEGDWGRN